MGNHAETAPGCAVPLVRAGIWLRAILAIVSIGFVLLFCYTALRRMSYPFSFDQIEGGTVTAVWRIAHRQPLYVAPTRDFVPYLYAPLYFYVAATLSKLVGIGYACLRLTSILGSLGCFAILYVLVYSETYSRLIALSSAGLYAASYSAVQGWFDLGRVDSLFVFLFLLAIYCSRRAPILLAVLVWLVAFQVKQTILPVAILVICADWQRPRRMALGLIALTAGFAASILIANHLTGGWYTFYLFGTAKGLPWVMRTAVLYIPVDLLRPFALGLLILLASLLCLPPRLRSPSTQFYLWVSFAIYSSIGYLRAHAGSALNTLMPAYAWTAVLFGIGLHRMLCWTHAKESGDRALCQALLLSAGVVQILVFTYNPGRYDPSPAMRQAREQFEQQLRSLPGDVYVINHSYDAILAGKQPHAVIDAFGIILDSPPSALRSAYISDFQHAVDAHVYSGFVLDDTADSYEPGAGWMPADFLAQYPVKLLAVSSAAKGVMPQPVEKWIYLPCSALAANTSSFIHPDSILSYGSCAELLTSRR